MLVLIAILLVLVPAIAILYPFVRRRDGDAPARDEGSVRTHLARRWDEALAALKSAELERAIGNLAEEDYHWLREQYMTEASLVLKAMEVEEQQEQDLLASIEHEVQQVRLQALGDNGADPPATCPECSAQAPRGTSSCPACGADIATDVASGSQPEQTLGE